MLHKPHGAQAKGLGLHCLRPNPVTIAEWLSVREGGARCRRSNLVPWQSRYGHSLATFGVMLVSNWVFHILGGINVSLV